MEQIFEQRSAEALDELVAEDFVSHTWQSSGDGRAALKAATDRMASALIHVRFVIEDIIAEDDRVCVRLTASARPVGDFMGMPASGNSYTIGEIHIFRLAAGRIAEHWHQLDALGMMRQLGGDG